VTGHAPGSALMIEAILCRFRLLQTVAVHAWSRSLTDDVIGLFERRIDDNQSLLPRQSTTEYNQSITTVKNDQNKQNV
jgi:hypothetical protein